MTCKRRSSASAVVTNTSGRRSSLSLPIKSSTTDAVQIVQKEVENEQIHVPREDAVNRVASGENAWQKAYFFHVLKYPFNAFASIGLLLAISRLFLSCVLPAADIKILPYVWRYGAPLSAADVFVCRFYETAGVFQRGGVGGSAAHNARNLPRALLFGEHARAGTRAPAGLFFIIHSTAGWA